MLACFKLEAVPTAQSLVWVEETQGLMLRDGVWWDRWRHFESYRREAVQAVGLRWKNLWFSAASCREYTRE